MQLAPRLARAIDLAVGERPAGPIHIDADGQRIDRHAAGRIVRGRALRQGLSVTDRHAPDIVATVGAGASRSVRSSLPHIVHQGNLGG